MPFGTGHVAFFRFEELFFVCCKQLWLDWIGADESGESESKLETENNKTMSWKIQKRDEENKRVDG